MHFLGIRRRQRTEYRREYHNKQKTQNGYELFHHHVFLLKMGSVLLKIEFLPNFIVAEKIIL